MNENLSNAAYFTFLLGDVTYAVEVTTVKEVLPYEKVTPVPRTAEYMKGVINIRGTVVTVIDFRVLFGIDIKPVKKDTSIIVAEIQQDDGSNMTFGFIADSVNGVGPLEREPSATGTNTQFVKMLGKDGDNLVLVLDLNKIFCEVENRLNS
jgi:purine-binding chemotaxis protein CheW